MYKCIELDMREILMWRSPARAQASDLSGMSWVNKKRAIRYLSPLLFTFSGHIDYE